VRWHERVQQAWTNPALNWELATRMTREEMRSVVSWLSGETWHVFWTQTYRGRHSESAAMVRWQHFLAEHNLLSILKAHMWAVEPHSNFPSHHVHALLSMKSTESFQIFWSEWRGWKEKAWREMGKALILKADEKAPIYYALKYVLKRRRSSSSTTRTAENLWGVWTSTRGESRLWS